MGDNQRETKCQENRDMLVRSLTVTANLCFRVAKRVLRCATGTSSAALYKSRMYKKI